MKFILVVLMTLVLGFTVNAQRQATAFEAASVARSAANIHDMSIGVDLSRSRFIATNADFIHLLIWAYGILPQQIVQTIGPADWSSQRFNIQGQAPKAGSPYSRGDISVMLQRLIEDRFKLTFHWEDERFVIDHLAQPSAD